MNIDFRLTKRDETLARAARLREEAAQGGNALDTPENLIARAIRAERFAAWIDAKVEAFPVSTEVA